MQFFIVILYKLWLIIQLIFKNLNVDFITGSAHKFHGPKGVGFIYISDNINIKPFISGGSQERNMRAGTENVHSIAGLAKQWKFLIQIWKKIRNISLILKNI